MPSDPFSTIISVSYEIFNSSTWWEIINTDSTSFNLFWIRLRTASEPFLSKKSKPSSNTKILECTLSWLLNKSLSANWIIISTFCFSPPERA